MKFMTDEDWNSFYHYEGKIKFNSEQKANIKRLYEEYVSKSQIIDWNCGLCVKEAVSILKKYKRK